jgi:tetratricopeptide (TPR) repeat protein
MLNNFYGHFLGDVGRHRAALPFFDRAMAVDPMDPHLQTMRVGALWATGRLDEADAAIEEAIDLWPRHYAVWFVHHRLLAHTGRGKLALAKIADTALRPTGIPNWNFELCAKEARALETRSKADVDAGMVAHLDAARRGVGFAEIAVSFASAVGRLDDAFAVLMAYYFNHGFRLGDLRYTSEQGRFVAQRRRNSWFLFLPPTAALRADPRFGRLMNKIGLEDYWRRSGTVPDYRARR